MSDVIETQRKIQHMIDLINEERPKLSDMAHTKAVTAAEYDKSIAVCIMSMNAGKPMTLNGESISGPAKSIMDKLAKGICWKERMDADIADAAYRSHVIKLECCKTSISILKSLESAITLDQSFFLK